MLIYRFCVNPKTNANIHLAEHIFNYGGHLLHDLKGEPTVPENSAFPVPTNDRAFEYSTISRLDPGCDGGYSQFYGPGPNGKCLYRKSGALKPYRSIQQFKRFDGDETPSYHVLVYGSTDCNEATYLTTLSEYDDKCYEWDNKNISARFVPKFNWA